MNRRLIVIVVLVSLVIAVLTARKLTAASPGGHMIPGHQVFTPASFALEPDGVPTYSTSPFTSNPPTATLTVNQYAVHIPDTSEIRDEPEEQLTAELLDAHGKP